MRIVTMTAVAVLTLGLAPVALAQSAEGTMAPPAAAPMTSVDDRTLEQFADAYQEVATLHRALGESLESVESQEEAMALQQQTQQAMADAVVQSGMSVQEYNQVAEAIGSDPSLMARFEAIAE